MPPVRNRQSRRIQYKKGGSAVPVPVADSLQITPSALYNGIDNCPPAEDASEDLKFRCAAHVAAPDVLNAWLSGPRAPAIATILNMFDTNGNVKPDAKLLDGTPFVLTATAFNDLYKWTMLPVVRKLEQFKNSIKVTFGIDLREPEMRLALKESPELRNRIKAALESLTSRKFDTNLFRAVLTGPRATILEETDIAAVCGPDPANPRSLVDGEVFYQETIYAADGTRTLTQGADQNNVNVNFYFDEKACYFPEKATEAEKERGVWFVEATGPWHKVTWLETSMMQCVYEAKLKYDLDMSPKNQAFYGKPKVSYGEWLYGALLRCAKSVNYTDSVCKAYPGLVLPSLFTGRRTGGMAFLLLQNLFLADHFKQGPAPLLKYSDKPSNPLNLKDPLPGLSTAVPTTTPCVGTSSCDSWYFLTQKLDLPCLNPVGTHAHELSMVTSGLYPMLDNRPGKPYVTTQIMGHYLYKKYVWAKTKGLMPMLPDTLGTPAFLRAASHYSVPISESNPELAPFLTAPVPVPGTLARQDSGTLVQFNENMKMAGYTGASMASEIDDSKTLLEAAHNGYKYFGAGGFFGDSEKVWGKKVPSNSMAVKAVRVSYTVKPEEDLGNYRFPYTKVDDATRTVIAYPVKTGDAASGKLSIDKGAADMIDGIKAYAVSVKAQPFPPTDPIEPLDSVFNTDTGLYNVSPANAQGGGYRKGRKTRRNNKAKSYRRRS